MELTRTEIEAQIAAGQVWKHTKSGKFYQIVCMSEHTESGIELVTYRLTNASKKNHTRPKAMFLDAGGPDGAYRFQRVR